MRAGFKTRLSDLECSPRFVRMRRTVLVAISLLSFISPLARATDPRLTSITPSGGQQGAELEVNFNGERLQDTEEIICYEPGIQITKLNSITNNLVKAQVKLRNPHQGAFPSDGTPWNCSFGEHHLRLRAKSGLSEVRTFFVGPFPVVNETEPNNQFTNAQKISLNSTVAGVIAS